MGNKLFNVSSEVERGAAYLKAGQFQLAEKIFSEVLRINPRNSDALHMLGIIASYKGNKTDAIRLIRKAIRLNPKIAIYQRNLGLAFAEAGKNREAIMAFKRAIHLDKTDYWSHNDIGVIYSKIGQYENSVLEYKKAIKKDPDNFQILSNLASDLSKIGEIDQAIDVFNKAIIINPDSYSTYYNLGVVLSDSGRIEKAVEAYRHAIMINPEDYNTYNNLGNLFSRMGNQDEAAKVYRKAIIIDSEREEAYNGLGIVCKNKGDFAEAVAVYRKALEINPQNKEIWIGLAHTQKKQGNIEDAISCYKRSIEIDSDNILSVSSVFDCFRMICDWKNADDMSNVLDKIINSDMDLHDQPPVPPFLSLYTVSDPLSLLGQVREWCRYYLLKYYNQSLFSFSRSYLDVDYKIKIGYISHDFRNHPVGILIHNLFQYHNREKFEVYVYSYGPDDGSFFRKSVVAGADYFYDIKNLDYLSSAKKIFSDNIDILVDLTGFTDGGRHEICAYKPAPVQVNYLGFPGSSGADFFDYIITDCVLSPFGHEKFYSEKLVRLPDCYQVNSQHIEPSHNNYSRSDFSLPDNDIVFCSFNNSRKIDRIVFRSWMNILKDVDGSVLWLQSKNKLQVRNLRDEARKRHVDPDRLIFSETLPMSEHMERHALADIALDTFSYNGGITTSLSLSINVPVVTMQGDRYVSRMSSSLLSSVSLPELIAYNSTEYENKAIELANNPELLLYIKNKLALSVKDGPLFDIKNFAGNLENAYTEMWNKYINKDEPSHISVE